MHTPVFFANLLIATKILGQLHNFEAPSEHQTRVGVQLKSKLMLYWKACNILTYYLQGAKCTLCCDHKLLEPFLTRGMKIAKLERQCCFRSMTHICPHKRKGQHPCQCYLQTLHTRYLWKGNKNPALTCSKDNHHTAGRHNWMHPAYRFSTTATITQHGLCYTMYTTKTR